MRSHRSLTLARHVEHGTIQSWGHTTASVDVALRMKHYQNSIYAKLLYIIDPVRAMRTSCHSTRTPGALFSEHTCKLQDENFELI